MENKVIHHTIGVLAHVDAGKTTLIEQFLFASGKREKAGRVDDGTAFLDTETQERARGITISSKMCRINAGCTELTMIDTPGHVDFIAEAERVLPVLDAAILVIGAGERIPVHARYLFRLLRERGIPTLIFFNKMDLPVPDRKKLMEIIRSALGDGFVAWRESRGAYLSGSEDGTEGERSGSDTEAEDEEIATLDEELLERFLETGEILPEDRRRLFMTGKLFPCLFGAALRGEGVQHLLDTLRELLPSERPSVEDRPFGAFCYKILHDESGQKISFLKILSGKLSVRDTVEYAPKSCSAGEDTSDGAEWIREKVTQIRYYDGATYSQIPEAEAGQIVAVTGLSGTYAGCGLGIAPSGTAKDSHPMLRYRLILPEEVDPAGFLPNLRVLEEEEDTLSITWQEEQKEINAELYGEVQLEILAEKIRERFGIQVSFGEGTILYRETLEEPSYGVGHFEPLRHYAEVHFLLEPLPRGTGIIVESRLSTDELDRNWQQTIRNAVEEEPLTGVLTNSPLTDLRITLAAGRAHKKHTEGGDFREAALRAIRQGLMNGRSILLEPYVRFTLVVPKESLGRALYDMSQMAEENRIVSQNETETEIEGRGPASTLMNYPSQLREYTGGQGVFRTVYDGYDRCRDQEKVVSGSGYEPESDLRRPAGSVFVDHGAAVQIPWDQAPQWMHLESRFTKFYPDPSEETAGPSGENIRRRTASDEPAAIGTEEIDRILQQASHANQSSEHASERRNKWKRTNAALSSSGCSGSHSASGKSRTGRKKYLLVDGYNIVHAWEETRGIVEENLDSARGILLDMLAEYRSMIDSEIIVVFDAYRVSGHKTEIMDVQNLHVVFTREAETADQYIARFTTENDRKYDITVATSDGLIQLIIRGADARLLSARELRDDVRMKKEDLGRSLSMLNSGPLKESMDSSGDL